MAIAEALETSTPLQPSPKHALPRGALAQSASVVHERSALATSGSILAFIAAARPAQLSVAPSVIVTSEPWW
jgi:L-lactate utilization protein LutC